MNNPRGVQNNSTNQPNQDNSQHITGSKLSVNYRQSASREATNCCKSGPATANPDNPGQYETTRKKFFRDGENSCEKGDAGPPSGDRSRLHRAALEYARRGVPVFPCRPGGKEPIGKLVPNGHKDANTDTRRINLWWNRWPNANIGIPTGERSGIFVLDVDQPASLDALEAEHGNLPETSTVGTGGGGMHYLFRYPEGESIRNSEKKIAPNMDVRGEGGYIIAPPSRTERPYEWLDRWPLAAPPEWLLELLRKSRPDKQGTSFAEARDSILRALGEADGVITLGETGPIPAGRRNRTLFEFACSMRGRGYEHRDILEALERMNAESCEPPLEGGEVSKVAASAAQFPRGTGSKAPPTEVLEALTDLEGVELDGPEWKGKRARTAMSGYKALIKLARRYGSLIPAGVRVQVSIRALALEAGTSKSTINDSALPWLREHGKIRRDGSGEKGKAGAFVLVMRAKSVHSTTGVRSGGTVPTLRAPRLRWSAPFIKRLGKTAEAIFDYLEASGGSSTLLEIADHLNLSRPRDLRRKDGPLSRLQRAVVVECSGDTVSLLDGWLEALEREREIADELAAERQDRLRYSLEREAYTRRRENPPERAPTAAEMEERRRVREEADGFIEDLERAEVPELSEDELRSLGAIRAFEVKHGRGSFGWDRAGCKRMFYTGPIPGLWPGPDQLERIREYLELSGQSLEASGACAA